MSINTINIKFIPALFPGVDFQDTIISTYRIIEMNEYYPVLIETDRKFSSIFNRNYSKNQTVQSIIYKKYQLEIFVTENTKIDNVKYADNIIIVTNEGETFEAKIINITYDTQPDSTITHATLEFYRISDDSNAVNNYLIGDYILQRADITEVYRLRFTSNMYIDGDINFTDGNYFEIYTALVPFVDRSEMILAEGELGNSIKIPINTIDSEVYQLRFYLTETEKNRLKKYYKRCTCTLYNDSISLNINAIENISIEITNNEELVNLYQADIMVKTNLINMYHFE